MDPMSENDNPDGEHSDALSEEIPIEHKCELCGTEFVTPTSLKIHRLKCVKMHKEQQKNQTPVPPLVQPDVKAPEPEVAPKAAEPEPDVPKAKPERRLSAAEIFAATMSSRPSVNVCQFCSDEFRSETSLKMHKLICVNKKKTEKELSETEQSNKKLVKVSASSLEKTVQKEKTSTAPSVLPPRPALPKIAASQPPEVRTPEPEIRTPEPEVSTPDSHPPSRPNSALLCESRKVDPIRDFFIKQQKFKKSSTQVRKEAETDIRTPEPEVRTTEPEVRTPEPEVRTSINIDPSKKITEGKNEEISLVTPPPLPGIKIKVPKSIPQPEVFAPSPEPEAAHPEEKKPEVENEDKIQDDSENYSNSILFQHFQSYKTQQNIEAPLPKKSPLKLKISLSSSNSSSADLTKKSKKIRKKQKLPKISILPPKPQPKVPILGAFVTRPESSRSKGQEIHHKRKGPESHQSEVPKLKVPKLVINIGNRFKNNVNENPFETANEALAENLPKIMPCKVSLQNLEMPPSVMSKKFLNMKKVRETYPGGKKLMGPARKRLLKIKEIVEPTKETEKSEEIADFEAKKKVPKLSLNIKEIPKIPELNAQAAALTPNAILKKKLNIKPVEPEIRNPEPEEKKSPTASISRKKLNIRPMAETEVSRTPEPEIKTPTSSAPITRKKLNIKPMQEPEVVRKPHSFDIKTKKKLIIKPVHGISAISTNLEPLPPLPFCPNKKKICIKNIPKTGNHPPEADVSEPQSIPALPVRKYTIKDVVPPEEKQEKQPVIESKVESKNESRVVKPISIKLNQAAPEIKKPEVAAAVSDKIEEARPALKLSLRNLKQQQEKKSQEAAKSNVLSEKQTTDLNSTVPTEKSVPKKKLNIKPIGKSNF